jgi:hypothetical protein
MRLRVIVIFILLPLSGNIDLLAQGPGLSLSGGLNYSIPNAGDAFVPTAFSEVADNRFKTYQVLTQTAFRFRPQAGAFISGGLHWKITPSILLGTGLGLQYRAFALSPEFVGYAALPGGSDTLLLPILQTQPVCDDIIFPEGFDPETNPYYEHRQWQVDIPLEIRLRPGSGKLELAAGVWAGLSAGNRLAKESVRINRVYRPVPGDLATLECRYEKTILTDRSGDGIRDLVWGLRGELHYRLTPAAGIFGTYGINLTNTYNTETKPDLFGRQIDGMDARIQTIQLGFRYLWEAETDPGLAERRSKINRAGYRELFMKKKKTASRRSRRR